MLKFFSLLQVYFTNNLRQDDLPKMAAVNFRNEKLMFDPVNFRSVVPTFRKKPIFFHSNSLKKLVTKKNHISSPSSLTSRRRHHRRVHHLDLVRHHGGHLGRSICLSRRLVLHRRVCGRGDRHSVRLRDGADHQVHG